MRKVILIPTIIIVGIILIRLVSNVIIDNIKSKILKTYKPPEVVVEKVRTKQVHKTFDVAGRIESQKQVSIISRVSGYLEKSYFKEGSYVKTGDILFLIESDEYKNNADIAFAQVKKLKAELEYANKQLDRAVELVKSDYIAIAKYDEIKASRDSTLAQLNAAKSDLNNKNKDLSYTQIKAPISGKIGTVEVSAGNYINSSTEVLTTINSTNPMYVVFGLSSQDYNLLASIDKGNDDNRKIEVYPNGLSKKYEYYGVQNYFDNQINLASGTVMMRADIVNPDNKLIHGEFVKVKIFSNNTIKVLVIPIVAVKEDARGKYVYRLNAKNIPEITYIKTDGQVDDNWIVTEGLNINDTIIVNGVMKVIPNKPVKIVK